MGEDGGQSGECGVGTNSDAWDGAIGEDENGSDRVGMLLDLSSNALLGGLVLRNTASIGEPGRVKDANLRKWLPLLTTFTNAGTHHYAVIAHKFVNAGRFGFLLGGGLGDSKVIVINVVTVKDIGDEFQGRGFADTSLPKKQDGV